MRLEAHIQQTNALVSCGACRTLPQLSQRGALPRASSVSVSSSGGAWPASISGRSTTLPAITVVTKPVRQESNVRWSVAGACSQPRLGADGGGHAGPDPGVEEVPVLRI